MARLNIFLLPNEREALVILAQRERRDPREQAALFVIDGLKRVGLLDTELQPALNRQPQQVQGKETE